MSARQPRVARTRFTLLCALLGIGAALTLALPAHAEMAGWARFTFDAAEKTGTMTQRPTGFPRADFVTTSSLGSGVGVQTGASAFLPPQSAPGQKYGSSQSAGYLNLRPAGRTTAQASVTTYTFTKPTPATGWTFVLGDIDADEVTISATDADGAPVDPADLGFRSAFNYCAPGVSPKPACPLPLNNGTFVPTWNATTGVLLGDTPAFRDTAGSSAWFEPRVALSTLTFTYALRQGSPVYQTWFSALQYDLTGTVTAPDSQEVGLTLRLLGPDGEEVATTTTEADGTYRFPGLATYDGYTVALVRPDDLVPDGQDPLTRSVDLSTSSQVENFALRAPVPSAAEVPGTVRDTDGNPVAGVTVTLTGNGVNRTATTDGDGNYVFDGVAVGTGYTVTATPPDGTTVDGPLTFAVTSTSTPVPPQNFTVTPIPAPPRGALSGTVTQQGTGDPLSNVLIVVSGPGGDREIRTDVDGTWTVPDLEPGPYTVEVRPEAGNTVVGQDERTTTINAQGDDVGGLGFVLAPPLAPPVERQTASGTVTTADGTPVAGATVTAIDPFDGEEFTDVTDAQGNWTIPGLYPDTGWRATVNPPAGYQVVGGRTQTFDLLDDATDVDFVLARVATPTPTSGPTTADPTTTEPTEVATSDSASAVAVDGLADTGGPAAWLIAVGLLLLGAGTLTYRRRGRHD